MTARLPGLVRTDVRPYDSLGALLDDALVQFKSETALIEASRSREVGRWNYLDFRRIGLRVARRLELVDVGAGHRVAILASNQSKWLFTAYGALRRGCVLVPLDYKLTAPEQQALLAHARPDVLVVEYGLYKRFQGDIEATHVWITEAPEGVDLGRAQRWEELPEGAGAAVPRERSDQATLVYSSGTAGTPKGCVLSHGAYLSQLDALLDVFPMEPGDRYFSILPTNHAIDFMCGFVGPLVCGASVVHQRTLRPEQLRGTMQRYGITHMAVVPLILNAFERAVQERLDELPGWQRAAIDTLIETNAKLTERGPRHGLSRRLLRPLHQGFGGRLRLVFCGGAPTDRDTAEFFYRLGIPVVIGYGLTEACTVATVHRLQPWRADGVGCPVSGVQIRIDQPDPHGVGEVVISGPTLFDGYLDAPELTRETLRDGWLHTGDLGWLDASDHLHLVGRSKNMIVTPGGKNVYPEDVEGGLTNVPCEELVVFASSALFPTGTLEYGELVVVVRPKEDAPRWLDDLRTANRALADYKRVGGVLVWDREFPRTASMKVKRSVLAEQLRDASSEAAIRPLLDLATHG